MPGAKKHNFVIRKFSRAERERMRADDVFYFDQDAWEAMLASMGPGPMRRGDKHTPEAIAKQQATRKRNLAAKQRAIAEAKLAARQAERAAKRDATLAARLLKAMQPGEWYGAVDLAVAVYGGDVDADRRRRIRMTLTRLRRYGAVRCVRNGEWKGNVRNVEPEKLWTLTAAGIERARKARGAATRDRRGRIVAVGCEPGE